MLFRSGNPAEPEQLYAAERALVDSYRVVPVVYLPETYALGPAVRNWMPQRWGLWSLEDVWMNAGPRGAAGGEKP